MSQARWTGDDPCGSSINFVAEGNVHGSSDNNDEAKVHDSRFRFYRHSSSPDFSSDT